MKYTLICQSCGLRHCTDGSDVVEIKSAPIPKRADGKNSETMQLTKKFRCFGCGRVFTTITMPVEKKEEKIEEPPLPSGDEYLKYWENESLKSMRRK